MANSRIEESETDRRAEQTTARAAGLRHTADDGPGIARVVSRSKARFRYVDPSGGKIHEPETLARIKALAIPPAWSDVWISEDPDGHLQATGRDAKGRKQYRYHPRWRSVRDEAKFHRMVEFAHALPHLRRRVDRDLKLPGLPRAKVLAAVVRLLESTMVRVGNDEYARSNGSYGLTTLRDRHAEIRGGTLRLRFRAKHGIQWDVRLDDPTLAKIARRCRDLPGQELFQYLDDEGQVHDVGSADVNDYLREATSGEFTAKDFRTWTGTVLAAMALQEFEVADTQTQAKSNVLRAIERVAERLGNTPAVCRKCYVHPAVLDSYLDGSMVESAKTRADRELGCGLAKLRPEEAAVLVLLRRRLAVESAEARRGRPARVRRGPGSGKLTSKVSA